MKKKVIKGIIGLLLLFFVIGYMISKSNDIDQLLDLEFKKISFALTSKLQEQSNYKSPSVVFAINSLANNKFVPYGYKLVKTGYTGFQIDNENPNLRQVSGYLHYEDSIKRSIMLTHLTIYEINDEQITIKKSIVLPVMNTMLNVEMFVLRAKDVNDNFLSKYTNHYDLYKFVEKNAINLEEEKKSTNKKDDYYVFNFIMTPISLDSKIDFVVSKEQGKYTGISDISLNLNYGLYRVGVMRVTFAFNQKKPLYFKTFFTPGEKVPKTLRFPYLISEFSTNLQD